MNKKFEDIKDKDRFELAGVEFFVFSVSISGFNYSELGSNDTHWMCFKHPLIKKIKWLPPEPKFVEVTRYAPLLKSYRSKTCLGISLFETKDEALCYGNENSIHEDVIGYTEVNCWIKEGEE